MHSWRDSHSISTSSYGVKGVRAEDQVFKSELHIHIHLV